MIKTIAIIAELINFLLLPFLVGKNLWKHDMNGFLGWYCAFVWFLIAMGYEYT